MDLNKSQFFFERGSFGSTIRTFKRRRKLVLFNGKEEPLRLIELKQWTQLRDTWPEHVKTDGLHVRTVWVLEEVK
ncbi:hypothetical protein [Brucella sp. 10RB9210]|uniref:hypothetical protein n=1 Tax=Brucella sp. 10RB9210 TaxID=1844037 RepID=UPI000972A464|nr:hypothetical protein [Brucella sp. 10RB9210]APX69573.1 hypothetical protein BKD03_09375 [Brucella sp. 09RB8471]